MILVPCPWCGPRNAEEFRYVGEVLPRPDPGTASPAEWRGYLYLRANAQGEAAETWYHRMGCRRYLRLVRDRQTNAFRAAPPPTPAPRLPDEPRRPDGTEPRRPDGTKPRRPQGTDPRRPDGAP